MARKTLSRPVLILGAAGLVAATLAAAFWPRATIVDMGTVTRGAMMQTIDEEGRTRVREAYVVSTPVAGRLLRIDAHPGDPVTANETVVAQMRPADPVALDVRTREQALAAVQAAEAALRVAEASLAAARADADLAQSDLDRTQRLADSGTASPAALDRAQSAARAAIAQVGTADAAIAMRRAELQAAQAQLIGFDDQGLLAALEDQLGEEFPIISPADGVILQVFQPDETTLAAGTPILEVGDIGNGLEVIIDLISSDAVQVSVGDRVLIENWGGPAVLEAKITRVEPYGRTKVSALGVEEQRVTVVTRLMSPHDMRDGLGHGYRVDARIVVWEAADVLIVPSAALFRHGDGWAGFRVSEGKVQLVEVEIGHDNGLTAEVLGGLSENDTLVIYPPSGMVTGTSVARRQIE